MSLDVTALRALAKILAPLQDLAVEAEKLNSIDQAIAEGTKRLADVRAQAKAIEAKAASVEAAAKAEAREAKDFAAKTLEDARLEVAALRKAASDEIERDQAKAADLAAQRLASVNGKIEAAKLDLKVHTETVAAVKEELNTSLRKLDEAKAAARKLLGE